MSIKAYYPNFEGFNIRPGDPITLKGRAVGRVERVIPVGEPSDPGVELLVEITDAELEESIGTYSIRDFSYGVCG